jgi:hypothetical protein
MEETGKPPQSANSNSTEPEPAPDGYWTDARLRSAKPVDLPERPPREQPYSAGDPGECEADPG